MEKFLLLTFLVLTLGGCSIVAKTPEPNWTSIRKDGDIEIRSYDPMVMAEVTTKGERYDAINAGFRILAGYIFGGNQGKKELEMTAPVIQQSSDKSGEKIEMTAPVIQQNSGVHDEWKVIFVMPANYKSAQELPIPNDKRINFLEVPAHKKVVIRFSGFNSDNNLKKHRDILNDWILKNNIKTFGQPVYAFYNPPWTPFFLRRNEIMLGVME